MPWNQSHGTDRLDHRRWRASLAALLIMVACVGGCTTSSNKWVALRSTPKNPLSDTLGLLTRQGPKPTERTMQLLRRYDLDNSLSGDRGKLLAELEKIEQREPHRDHVYAMAELAYVGGKRAEQARQHEQALELYSASVLHAYHYLFDEEYPEETNFYDPQFRRACDLYNTALEGTLRIVQKQGNLKPGTTQVIQTSNHACQLEINWRSENWQADDFDHFEFVSDYEVQRLRNRYHNYGLGVPLVAVRKKKEGVDPREEFYPEDLSFPLTAFLRVVSTPTDQSPSLYAALELHDPLDHAKVDVIQSHVPLETDLSTPLAYTLSQPSLDDTHLSTLGLLNPTKAKNVQGLYMLEPFQKDKIPVLMVHGLWSSPVTWMEMFNDLRSDPQIRENFQFWFYLYPTGQPFWFSAAQMREDLNHMRATVDPEHQYPALDQMVLVGHSMGGLVAELQTIDSGNQFWNTLSDHPFAELDADNEVRQGLARTFFFDPNPSIRRVITIATPHRGSEFSNDLTRWLGRKIIKIPSLIMLGKHQLIARNPDFFRPGAPLNVTTSIDSLAPESPLLPVLLTAQHGPWVKYHNIVGEKPHKGITGWLSGGSGDGVVTLDSARIENASSQIAVPADHSSVLRHPQSILEVRRILLEHVAELNNFPYGGGVEQVSSVESQASSVESQTSAASILK